MNAEVFLTREQVLTVRTYDLDPFVTLAVGAWSVHLTRDQARQAADALRAGAMTKIDDLFG